MKENMYFTYTGINLLILGQINGSVIAVDVFGLVKFSSLLEST